MNLKKIFSVFIITIIFLPNLINAQQSGFGIGIMFGEPTGISGKYWLEQNTAVDFGLAYSIFDDKNFTLHTDYLHHNSSILNTNYPLELYYGFGARFRFKSDEKSSLGVRGVIGVVWLDQKLPLDIFFEMAPVFRLFPSTGLEFDIALGARWYFETE